MAEPARRRSPAAHLAERIERARSGAIALREVPFLAQVDLRVDPSETAAVAALEAALGLDLPRRPNTVSLGEARDVLWLGPDEWLVVGPEGEELALERALRQALGSSTGSVVDVSANRTTLELAGPAAREVLAKGCPLDLHPRTFAAGSCAQTLLAKANVVIVQRDDDPAYRVLVRPSFADYLVCWLLDAMAEFA